MFWSILTCVLVLGLSRTGFSQFQDPQEELDLKVNQLLDLEYVDITLPYYGTLQGQKFRLVTPKLTYWRQKTFWAEQFFGIPYARPPVGEFRFQQPVHADPWSGLYKATYHRNACPQYSDYIETVLPEFDSRRIQEDCLYLNVYRPSKSTYDPLLPVMVFIHGGDWNYGTAEMYNATYISATKDVIVVTINYRLGALGFLSTEDQYSRGNYGLWDQVEALKWVQENIKHFGGNNRRVTLFGVGTGAASIGLLMLSPYTEGLFKRAILQSGTAVSPFAVIPENYSPREFARELGAYHNCPVTYSSYELVKCLKALPHTSIYTVNVEGNPDTGAWAPVVDGPGNGRFLKAYPLDLLNEGKFLNIDIINGVVRDERSYVLLPLPQVQYGVKPEVFIEEVREMVQERHYFGTDILANVSVYEYTNWSTPFNETSIRDQYIDLLTDRDFVAPMIQTNRYHSESGENNVFMYTFNYRSNRSVFPAWMGVPHTGEIPFLFGEPFNWASTRHNWTLDDRAVSDLMMTMWTNFAKYGNPTPVPGSVHEPPEYQEPSFPAEPWDYTDEEWFPYRAVKNETYLHIDVNCSVRTEYRNRKAAFWNILAPNLVPVSDKPPTWYYWSSCSLTSLSQTCVMLWICAVLFFTNIL
ncbi:neuroligin-4, Y-linked-like [Ptychodera flava]|uniref:neuroligin-4, Y-linked-like n=1 Tax=Ptychodera flava TaxID=63121 RepID=UPI00396A8F4C